MAQRRYHVWLPYLRRMPFHPSVKIRRQRASQASSMMAGLGTLQANTRNGVFANEGWGGGVFNYNTAFGGLDGTPGGVQGLGAVTWDGRTLPSTGIPKWREPSDETLNMQFRVNADLAKLEKCPLLVDGELGPRTCGALLFLDEYWRTTADPIISVPPMVSVCLSPPEPPIAPTNCPAGEPPPPPEPPPVEPPVEPPPVEPPPEKAGGIGAGVLVAGLLVLGAGAAVAMTRRKKR